MLSQFTVRNYKSIRDEVTLDMQATAISEHPEHIITSPNGENYLPIAVIYGPNGGGKSNVLSAMHSLKSYVLRPLMAAGATTAIISAMPAIPFQFDEATRSVPTEFEIYFHAGKTEYRYILHIQSGKVVYERLDRYKYDTGKRSALFERTESGTEFKGDLARIKDPAGLSDNFPTLSYLGMSYRNNIVVNEVICWFESDILFLNYGNPMNEQRMAISLDDRVRRLMLDMIHEMDIDIEDYRIDQTKSDRLEIYTRHLVNNVETELELREESSGTVKLFSLLPDIAEALLTGGTLVIDELDAKIHPLLLRYLITTFTDSAKNQHGAQLIFTSHDLSTMNNEIFRRDEIWFVAKGEEQNSQLYSLVEFRTEDGTSVRKDATYNKQYLEGKYGADPYLRRIINWGQIHG